MLRQEIEKALNKNRIVSPKQNSPIYALMVARNLGAKMVANNLQQMGFDTRAILAPMVAEDTERNRIGLLSFNEVRDVQQLAMAIQKLREN